MVNEQLAMKFEDCRMAADTARARVKLWEDWAEAEKAAQRKGTE